MHRLGAKYHKSTLPTGVLIISCRFLPILVELLRSRAMSQFTLPEQCQRQYAETLAQDELILYSCCWKTACFLTHKNTPLCGTPETLLVASLL